MKTQVKQFAPRRTSSHSPPKPLHAHFYETGDMDELVREEVEVYIDGNMFSTNGNM